MKTRILSALVMAPVAFAAIWFGTPYFEILVCVVGFIAVLEWVGLMKGRGDSRQRKIYLILGIGYLIIPCLVLVWLRQINPQGLNIVIWFFLVIWSTDIGAYFIGKSLGGPKLAPNISPNKTWSGFFGGLVFALIISLVLQSFVGEKIETMSLVLATVIISIVGQGGDLLESWVKRLLHVKDSGSIIPGHGGVLDRIDAILLAAPVVGLIALLNNIGTAPWK